MLLSVVQWTQTPNEKIFCESVSSLFERLRVCVEEEEEEEKKWLSRNESKGIT